MIRKAKAVYLEGQVKLDHPVDWPEGTRIVVQPTSDATASRDEIDALTRAWSEEGTYGLDESIWPTTREGIDFLLAHMDAAKPLDLTPEEQELIDRDLASNKSLQKELVRKSWDEPETLF